MPTVTVQQVFALALQHHQAGRLADAEAHYRQILAVQPNHAAALANLGEAYRVMGRFDEAVSSFRRALQLRPDLPQTQTNLGVALIAQGQPDGAIAAFRQALQLKPDYPEAHNNLGHVLRTQGHLDEAIAAFRSALACKPDFAEAHHNLGLALAARGQFGEAVTAYRRALQLKPDEPEFHNNLGTALAEQGQPEEAVAAYRRALQLKPDYPKAHHNLAATLAERGQFEEAMAAYRSALKLQPDYGSAKFNYSLLLLLHGDFEHGWPLNESRWEAFQYPERRFAQPRWNGSILDGQRVLLHAEQGFGDTIQFIRYAPLVVQRGGRVIVECQPELKPLLAGMEGVSQVLEHGEPLPAFDLHCPMVSLPLTFGTRVETIPAPIPYLKADPIKAARWRERLDRETNLTGDGNPSQRRPLKVGLIWAGGIRPHQPSANLIDQRRSMRLSQFGPLAGVPGVVFVSLQKGAPAAQAQTPPEGMTLLDWTEELRDFADTAALVEALDLVIGVDTAGVHLAGALGKPVWVLNRFDACWRWLRDRTDSPWYPTMRLFRQSTAGDWTTVIAEVREHLQALVQAHPNL